MSHPLKVLFLCTAGAARSVMAEVLLNDLGEGRFRAYGAGSRPTGEVSPLTIDQLHLCGYPTRTLRSRRWDEFAAPLAPAMDMVITVCDDLAGEVSLAWPGEPITAHWSVAAPGAFEGPEDAKRVRYALACYSITEKVRALVNLDDKLDRLTLEKRIRAIGRR
jgi:arsenate reductase